MVAPGIQALAALLRESGRHVTIETAATVAPGGIACDLASLSPKLLNSAPDPQTHATWRRKHEALRWQPGVVQAWIDAYAWQLKFVVAEPADVEEIEGILLMPEGATVGALRQRGRWVAELCQQRGFRYAPRLQIELYGSRRGT
jgi:7-carboxy-7-deazaguanine synthase